MSCMKKMFAAAGLSVLVSASAVWPQIPRLSFETASIKPNKTAGGASFGGCYRERAIIAVVPKGRCIFRNQTLISAIAEAYDIPFLRIDDLITGGPNWIRNDKYDVEAKAENDSATESDLNKMMKVLLAERFKLTLHETTRESAGYALVVAKCYAAR
jgi:uncharacterized protein (TIGR03435 family)